MIGVLSFVLSRVALNAMKKEYLLAKAEAVLVCSLMVCNRKTCEAIGNSHCPAVFLLEDTETPNEPLTGSLTTTECSRLASPAYSWVRIERSMVVTE